MFSKKYNTRRIVHLIHGFFGLKLTLLLTVVLLSGTLAVIAEEIDWLIYDEIRVTPVAERLNEGLLFDKLKEAYSDVGLSSFNTANDRTHTAASAMVTLPSGGFRSAWIDPYTGEVKGDTPLLSVGNFISFLHASLYLPVIGRSLVNAFGVFCLISLITGLISYRYFWRGFFQLPRWKRGPRVYLGDLHKLVGLWSLWFVLIIGVSGSWWFYQNPLEKYAGAPKLTPSYLTAPVVDHEDLSRLGPNTPTRVSAENIVTVIKKEHPDFEIHMLTPPDHNGLLYKVRGSYGDFLVSRTNSVIYVNPYTGKIVENRPASDWNAMQRFDAAMRPLHYGSWANSGVSDLLVKLIWFLFGLALTGMSVSGMVIYYKRTFKARNKNLPKTKYSRKFKKLWLILRPWGGSMSGFKYVNVLFVGGILAGCGIAYTLGGQGTSGSGYIYQQQAIGPWTLSFNAVAGLLEKDLPPIRAGRRTTLNATVEGGDASNIKFMYARVGKPRTTRAPGDVIHGPLGMQHAILKIPKNLKDSAELWITIEDWSGQFHQSSWSLMPNNKETRVAP
ncbi:PepSY-associated TM helix domain-containing protein [Alkalimarinus alittae]|uniref:PepSY domain-containing protein n=1 Tax=Alkalimarinus alittae TaxID=2961619 RepID=A0ABY6N519_9ALTE|nr:PepSY-associated TM helix domain-containing protein [Alkalimarinus alittae]UZE97069.1 PepSY domain-containing protein [Alkalimarinus alittae]